MVSHIMDKSAYFKTLEAFIALFIMLTFLVVFIPSQRTLSDITEPLGFLSHLRQDESFRHCGTARNTTCINQTLDRQIGDNFDFIFSVSDDPGTFVSNLPTKRVFSESVYMAGNISNTSTTIIRVFYYSKD
jgi:hypothetical protein